MVIPRNLHHVLVQHVDTFRQMAFLSGPRQVGKTTTIRHVLSQYENTNYLSWDDFSDRRIILDGTTSLSQHLNLAELISTPRICAFDELHKYSEWRDFLKGIFDGNPLLRILVTGSASLSVFSRGGDSLRGRYFGYTMHPLSVAELAHGGELTANESELTAPRELPNDQWDALLSFGGFPEPFAQASQTFHGRWSMTSNEQLFQEDIRDLTRIQELSQIEMLALRIQRQVGQLTSYSTFARDIRSTVPTIQRWIDVLESLYYCFRVTPWHRNVAGSLRKEPKYYLWDWSQVRDAGARAENLVASALLKFTRWRTEQGLGEHSLHFVRDKQKREVDFVVVRDDRPWILVEVKSGASKSLPKHLHHFQKQTRAAYAFQVSVESDYVDRDCFSETSPIIVPAKTFLSQLV